MIERNHMISAHRLSDVRHSQLLGKLSFLPARRGGREVNEPQRTTVPMNYFLCLILHRKMVFAVPYDTSNVCAKNIRPRELLDTPVYSRLHRRTPFPVRAGRRHGLGCHSSRWQPFFFSPMRGGFVSRSSPGSFSQIILLLAAVVPPSTPIFV
jgi:hypothetical protein